MPKLSARSATSPIKLMVIGDSGTGKTGALESLVRAGYKLRILDFDGGLDYLQEALSDSPELLDNVQYATFTNHFKTVNGRVIPKGNPKAWADALKTMETGKVGQGDDAEQWGKPEEWDENTFLVVDSLTMASKAAMLQVLHVNGRLFEPPQIQDWGQAQGLVEGLIQWICSEDIKCNVMVLSHINFIEMQNGLVKGYPSAVGKALSTTLPRYFNTILNATTKGSGKSATRIISPVPIQSIETKAMIPVEKLPESWPISTAYAQFMLLAKNKVPNASYKPKAGASSNSQPSGGNKLGLKG